MTSLIPMICQQRGCIHYHSQIGPDDDPVYLCMAFPTGIPAAIVAGADMHIIPEPGDDGIVFEADATELKHLAGQHDQRKHDPHKGGAVASNLPPVRHNGKLYETLGMAHSQDEFMNVLQEVAGTTDLTTLLDTGYSFEFVGNDWYLLRTDRPYKAAPVNRTAVRPYKPASALSVDDVQALKEDYKAKYPESQDALLESLVKQQGFDGLPDVVTETELMQYVGNGEVELWRGVSAPDYADNFRDGPLFIGHGISGNGSYAASMYDTAYAYAGKDGEVMHMTIRSDAKVIDYMTLHKQTEEARRGPYRAQLDTLFEAYGSGGIPKETFDKQYYDLQQRNTEYQNATERLFGDEGRVATLMGYDVLVNGNTYIILNRTAVRVAEGKQ